MFVSGIFCGLPSLYIEANNAVMIGSFDQFFASRGFGIDFWLVVFVHGTLEITAIILSCAAGLVMGKSFLFPGTISRWRSLQIGVKDGVKIVIGLMPIFAVAAFFDGFVTRYYNMPILLSSAILLACGTFILWYFVIYPIRLQKKFKEKALSKIVHV